MKALHDMDSSAGSERLREVAELHLQQALDEVGGQVVAPNRLDEILVRAAASQRQPGWRSLLHRRHWLAAAMVLLGLGITVTAAVLKQHSGQGVGFPGSGEPVAPANQWNQRSPVVAEEQSSPPRKAGNENVAQQQGAEPPSAAAKPSGKPDLPKGADPADLKAMRSAEAMLQAEQRLQAMIKSGKVAGVDQVLPFEQLGGWSYEAGLKGMPQRVRDLHDKKVVMLGFMLPIDEVQNIQEFLLVESLWGCCYGLPPDINGIVRCVMPLNMRLDYQFEPLKVVGTLKISATEMDGYIVDIYQLEVDYVEVLGAEQSK